MIESKSISPNLQIRVRHEDQESCLVGGNGKREEQQTASGRENLLSHELSPVGRRENIGRQRTWPPDISDKRCQLCVRDKKMEESLKVDKLQEPRHLAGMRLQSLIKGPQGPNQALGTNQKENKTTDLFSGTYSLIGGTGSEVRKSTVQF